MTIESGFGMAISKALNAAIFAVRANSWIAGDWVAKLLPSLLISMA